MKTFSRYQMFLTAIGAFALTLALTMSMEKWGRSFMPLGLPISAGLSAVAAMFFVLSLNFSKGFLQRVRNPLLAAAVGLIGGCFAVVIVSIAAGAIYLAFGSRGIEFGFGGSLYLLFAFIVGGILWSLPPVLVLGASVGLRACCCRSSVEC